MKRTILVAVILLLLSSTLAFGQSGSGTTTVSVTVGAEAALTVTTGTTTLTTTGYFANYTGTTSLTYYLRTTQSTGSGNIQLEVTTDFPCASGGPCVATPPSTGDALKYTCTVANPGNNGTATACTGSVTASTTAQTSVGTFGADNRSLSTGNSASVVWALTDDPKYKTGTYTATVTFTISAS